MNAAWPSEALWLLTGAAAFAAGVLNAIAGGGSFLTFPALVFAGVPPLAANATSAMAVSPGYLGSVFMACIRTCHTPPSQHQGKTGFRPAATPSNCACWANTLAT